MRVVEIAGVNPVWTVEAGNRVPLSPGQLLPLGAAFTVGNTTIVIATEEIEPPGARALELDATGVLTQPGASRLAALAALGEKLARCGSLAAVMRAATSWAVDALPAARALLLSPDGNDILSAASVGPLPDLALSAALLARVLRERRGVLLHDVLAEPDLADRRSVQMRGITGAMAAPVEGLIFYVEWGPREVLRTSGHAYDDEALRLLVCAAQLVSAIGDSARERQQLGAAARQGPPAVHGEMIGRSPAIQKLQVLLERVAATTSTVLVLGESGTGKELAAGMIHALSPRSGKPFVAINCAAIAESLLESELFGHEKGAFTGAVAQHDGVFVRAHGGTLFMDEIGELSPGAQARMLRVLENRTLTRVGGTRELGVDVRLIAATHRDLRRRVAEGSFREDLLYRIGVIQTEIPPLRDRRDDIPLLAEHFLRVIGERVGRRIDHIAPDAVEVLTRYRWPGNFRGLRNVLERALVLGDGPVLEVDDLPPELLHAAPAIPVATTGAGTVVRPLVELEREAIVSALAATGGNKARAAALLGIDRTTPVSQAQGSRDRLSSRSALILSGKLSTLRRNPYAYSC